MKRLTLTLLIMASIIVACEKVENVPHYSYKHGQLTSTEKQLTEIYRNNELYIRLLYDTLGRLSTLNMYRSDSVIYSEEYKYNADNQIIERKYNGITEFYHYQGKYLTEKYSQSESNPGWNPKTLYYYDDSKKMVKADNFFNDVWMGYTEFAYDNNGNTILRKEYLQAGDSNLISSEFRLQYDDKKSPALLMHEYPLDVIQKNNVVYRYYNSIVISCFPLEYVSDFVYDDQGFPLEEKRYRKSGTFLDSIPDQYTYVYSR